MDEKEKYAQLLSILNAEVNVIRKHNYISYLKSIKKVGEELDFIADLRASDWKSMDLDGLFKILTTASNRKNVLVLHLPDVFTNYIRYALHAIYEFQYEILEEQNRRKTLAPNNDTAN